MVSSNPASGRSRYGDNELGNITQKQNKLGNINIKLETEIKLGMSLFTLKLP